ncbi:Uncharacterized protein QTN25_009553 [Entamoeba marina]
METKGVDKHIFIIGEKASCTCLYLDHMNWPLDTQVNYELILRLAISLHVFSKNFYKPGIPPVFNKLVLSQKSVSTRRGKVNEKLVDLYSAESGHFVVLLTSHTTEETNYHDILEKLLDQFVVNHKEKLDSLQDRFDEYAKPRIEANKNEVEWIQEFLPFFKDYKPTF